MERSTIFSGKIHYQWPFSIAMLNYQRVWIILSYHHTYIYIIISVSIVNYITISWCTWHYDILMYLTVKWIYWILPASTGQGKNTIGIWWSKSLETSKAHRNDGFWHQTMQRSPQGCKKNGFAQHSTSPLRRVPTLSAPATVASAEAKWMCSNMGWI